MFCQRHISGVKSVDLQGGITQTGITGSLSYVHYMSTKSYLKVGLLYETGNRPASKNTQNNLAEGYILEEVPYWSGALNAYFNYKLFNVKDVFYVNGLVGITATYDHLKYSEVSDYNISSDKTVFSFGPILGIETETYFSDKLGLVVGAWQSYHPLVSDFSGIWYASAGLRYNF